MKTPVHRILSAPSELIELSHRLGDWQRQYVIGAEGNTSLRADADYFWVKASGQQLATITAPGFACVQFAPILELFQAPPLTLTAEREALRSACLDPASGYPSVETSFHAILQQDCGVACVAHTHPIAVNRLLCSQHAETFAKSRTCPDEVVLCGPESVFVPYRDPGLPLAMEIRSRTRLYMAKYQEAPKVILLANHGLIVLAQTTLEALHITDMCVKSAEILGGALAMGAAQFLSDAQVMHLYRRPDEIYRRSMLADGRRPQPPNQE